MKWVDLVLQIPKFSLHFLSLPTAADLSSLYYFMYICGNICASTA